MPPSGFSTRSADGLVTFLREAMNDLQSEVLGGKHSSLETGLAFEISQIGKVLLAKGDCGEEEKALLVLTKAFYENAKKEGEEKALQMARETVLSVHIDEMGKLAKR